VGLKVQSFVFICRQRDDQWGDGSLGDVVAVTHEHVDAVLSLQGCVPYLSGLLEVVILALVHIVLHDRFQAINQLIEGVMVLLG